MKYLFCDLDRTLLFDQSDGSYDINKEDLSMLEKLPQMHIELVIASGRACNAAEFIEKKLHYNVDMVALNGAMLLINGNKKQLAGLPIKDYQLITQDIAKQFPDTSMGTLHFDGNYYMKEPLKEDYIGRLRRHQLHDQPYGIQNDEPLFQLDDDLQVPKILFYVQRLSKPKQVYQYLMKKYGDRYDFLFSSPAIIECLPKAINKAVGIQRYMEMNHIAMEQCWVVGDSDNDIEMFQFISNSCCVEHGSTNAKKSAKYIVKNVAEVIQMMKELNRT